MGKGNGKGASWKGKEQNYKKNIKKCVKKLRGALKLTILEHQN